jgi:methionine-gamma-lyase
MLTPMSNLETRAVHAGMEGVREQGSHVPTIDLSTTNPLGDVETGGMSYEELATGGCLTEGRSAVYQRLWHPGVARFETALADLEGADGSVAFGTGMAALAATLIATVSEGRPHVVAVRPLYGGSDHVLESGLLGTQVTWSDVDGIAAAIRPDTGLVIVETPANPTLELIDLRRAADAAGDVPLLVDNTFATPVLQQPLALGADLVVHSVTKYLAGHADVIQGAVVAASAEVFAPVKFLQNAAGAVPSPFDCWLTLRGLQTLDLRVWRQVDNAQAIAAALAAHPRVTRVYYPGLPDHPGHTLARRQMRGFGAIVSFELDGSPDDVRAFVSSRRYFTLAESLGAVKALVCHPATMTHASIPAATRAALGLSDRLIRLSPGCEHHDDLVQDVVEGVDAVRYPQTAWLATS